MAFTFSPSLIVARDRMRFVLGDVSAADPLEQDETYDANLVLHGEELAVAVMAEALASRFAREPDSLSADGTSISWRERVKTWLALASGIRSRIDSGTSSVAGSIVGNRGESITSEYVRPAGAMWWTTR